MAAQNKKNIYFVISGLGGGGSEKVLSMILARLDRQRFKPKLILFTKSGEYLDSIPSDIEIVGLGKRTRWDFLKIFS